MYKRKEIATRISLFFGGSVFASAFGGLLAYGTFQLPPNSTYFDWSYLYLVEGPLTILTAIITFFALPKSIRGAYFLTQEEKDCAESRILSASVDRLTNEFSWAEAFREFKTWHVYLRILIGIAFGVVLSSNSLFLAPIVQSLGYGVVKTNLYTVAPACVASVFLVVVCVSSDRFQSRGLHMLPVLGLSVVGYVLLIKVDPLQQTGLAYFAIFLCTAGAYPVSPLFSAWMVDNITNLNARAVTVGLQVCLGHAAGLISANIFFANQSPRYMSALIGNTVCAAAAMVMSGAYVVWMRWENKRRDRVYGPVSDLTAGVGDTLDPNFRFRT